MRPSKLEGDETFDAEADYQGDYLYFAHLNIATDGDEMLDTLTATADVEVAVRRPTERLGRSTGVSRRPSPGALRQPDATTRPRPIRRRRLPPK